MKKRKSEGGNYFNKGFSAASRNILSHCRSMTMVHLDLVFASCCFSRTTGLEKTRGLFVRFFSTVVEHVFMGPAIRSLPLLPPPMTS